MEKPTIRKTKITTNQLGVDNIYEAFFKELREYKHNDRKIKIIMSPENYKIFNKAVEEHIAKLVHDGSLIIKE